MSELPKNVSKSVIARNPHLYGDNLPPVVLQQGYAKSFSVAAQTGTRPDNAHPGVQVKRIRQSDKPLLNKLESAWLAVLKLRHPGVNIRSQARRYKLATGAWYKPDLTAIIEGKEIAWECKGPRQGKNVDRGILTLKFAAHEWPEVTFWLVWKADGRWQEQKVLP